MHWQKPYIINMKCQKCVLPDLKRPGDTSYIGPYTDVNADGVLRLQDHQDIYMSLCTKFGCKKAI